MNPSYSPANGADVNSSGGSSVNQIRPSFRQNRNKFAYSKRKNITARYGDLTPIEVINCVPGETTPFGSTHELRTYTLKSPLMSQLRQLKTYIQVPMDAILPNTWELIYTNPTSGDDVPSDAYSQVPMSTLYNLCTRLFTVAKDTTKSIKVRIGSIFALESILSYGSVLNYLGCSLSCRFNFTNASVNYSFDKFFELVVVPQFISQIPLEAEVRRANFDLYREDPDKISVPSGFTLDLSGWSMLAPSTAVTKPFDFSRLVAYQLACAEFFSNQFIDYVYNAKLYRDNALSIMKKTNTSSQAPHFFTYNGRSILYDAFSGNSFNYIAALITNTSTTAAHYVEALQWLSLLFGYRRSLRATDYFTSGKNQPLGVGDVNAPVISGNVSAVDMTRSIQVQRFLNAVNRTGRKFSTYLKGIFGETVPPDRHEPHFLAQSGSEVNGMVVENTNQNLSDPNFKDNFQTTILHTQGGQYEFTCETDVPSIIVGILHYEIQRLYADAIERFFYHKDRYDFFNPFMQYIGDQPLYQSERYAKNSDSAAFSYQSRYCEYKQRFPSAHGGFAAGFLPSWAFIDQAPDYQIFNETIDSDNIRNANYELDRFYGSLQYYGLAGYFHFILLVQNNCDPVKPLEPRPNLL